MVAQFPLPVSPPVTAPDLSQYHIVTEHRFCRECGLELVLKLEGTYSTKTGKPIASLVCPMWMCGHTGHYCQYKRAKWWHRLRCVTCGQT